MNDKQLLILMRQYWIRLSAVYCEINEDCKGLNLEQTKTPISNSDSGRAAVLWPLEEFINEMENDMRILEQSLTAASEER